MKLSVSDLMGGNLKSSRMVLIKASEALTVTDPGRWNDSISAMNGKFYCNLRLSNIGPTAIQVSDNFALKSYQQSDGAQLVYPWINETALPSHTASGYSASWTSFFDLPLNRTPFGVIYAGWLEAKVPFVTLGNLTVFFIDVGQADSILIETPERLHVLIETGTKVPMPPS